MQEETISTQMRTAAIRERLPPWPNPEIPLSRCLNEAWFNATLAWLLNPKESHGLGVRFARAFLRRIAKKRSSLRDNDRPYYRSGTTLRHGKSSKGQLVRDLKLGNLSVFQEFFLPSIKDKWSASSGHLDLLMLDLDRRDSLAVVIEAKLFGTNSKEQLPTYAEAMTETFSALRIREFVYLTLLGSPPGPDADANPSNGARWVQLSWIGDIAECLQASMRKISSEGKPIPAGLAQFAQLLSWLKAATAPRGKNYDKHLEALRKHYLKGMTHVLLEHLNHLRLRPGSRWSVRKSRSKKKVLLAFSTTPSRPVTLRLKRSGDAEIRIRRESGANKEQRFVIPFGAQPDQLLHLLGVYAGAIYRMMFHDTYQHRNKNKRISSVSTEALSEFQPVLDLFYEHREQLLLSMQRRSS
jgi:hypothetical protein